MNIDELLESITKDPSKVNELDEEQLRAIEAKTSPYGVIVPEKEQHFTFSIMNLREEYMRKILMTSLVGYLFRLGHEYVPEYESPHSTSEIKFHVMKFLNRAFNFNPDHHVRTASKALEKPTPAQLSEIRAKCGEDVIGAKYLDLANKIETLPADAQEPAKVLLKSTGDTLLGGYHHCKDSADILRGLAKHSDMTPALQAAIIRAQLKLETHTNVLRALHDHLGSETHNIAAEVSVPAEVFYNWERYHNNHYEIMRELVAALYYDLPDIEFAVQFYGAHENEAAAADFVKKNQGKVIADILTAQNGAWTLLGPFLQNREKVDFYTKETEVIKKLFEQAEQDKLLIKDMVKKKVSKEKAKNIKDFGPDDKGLEEYRKVRGVIGELESKQNLTREEKKQLEDAVRQKEMMEVPDDAIQVDVFHTDAEGAFKRDKIYTQAEAPEPPKPGPEKTLVSRKGEKKPISELKDNIE